jgi:hypothetical protein
MALAPVLGANRFEQSPPFDPNGPVPLAFFDV